MRCEVRVLREGPTRDIVSCALSATVIVLVSCTCSTNTCTSPVEDEAYFSQKYQEHTEQYNCTGIFQHCYLYSRATGYRTKVDCARTKDERATRRPVTIDDVIMNSNLATVFSGFKSFVDVQNVSILRRRFLSDIAVVLPILPHQNIFKADVPNTVVLYLCPFSITLHQHFIIFPRFHPKTHLRIMSEQWDLQVCCMGAGYVGGPTMAVIAKMCPKVRFLSWMARVLVTVKHRPVCWW